MNPVADPGACASAYSSSGAIELAPLTCSAMNALPRLVPWLTFACSIARHESPVTKLLIVGPGEPARFTYDVDVRPSDTLIVLRSAVRAASVFAAVATRYCPALLTFAGPVWFMLSRISAFSWLAVRTAFVQVIGVVHAISGLRSRAAPGRRRAAARRP